MGRLGHRSVIVVAALGLAATAWAGPKKKAPPEPPLPAGLPQVGDELTPWTMKSWLDGAPLPAETAGKVVVHWFCAKKIKTCVEDSERLMTMREDDHVYVIAYINGNARDARALDPIHGAESKEPGAVAYGPDVAKHMKRLELGKGPSSIVVGTDGKIAMVTVDADTAALGARDAKISELVGQIKDYTQTTAGPTQVKVGEKFKLAFTINLAQWLTFTTDAPTDFTLAKPREWTCSAVELKADQLIRADHTLTAEITCSSSGTGSFEARGEIRFGYQSPAGATGIGADGHTWKLDIGK